MNGSGQSPGLSMSVPSIDAGRAASQVFHAGWTRWLGWFGTVALVGVAFMSRSVADQGAGAAKSVRRGGRAKGLPVVS